MIWNNPPAKVGRTKHADEVGEEEVVLIDEVGVMEKVGVIEEVDVVVEEELDMTIEKNWRW